MRLRAVETQVYPVLLTEHDDIQPPLDVFYSIQQALGRARPEASYCMDPYLNTTALVAQSSGLNSLQPIPSMYDLLLPEE